MDIETTASKLLGRLDPRVAGALYERAKRLPLVGDYLRKQVAQLIAELAPAAKPYQGAAPSYTRLPTAPVRREEISAQMRALRDREQERWRKGYASGAVYHGDDGHVSFLDQIYALHSQSNPLHADLWPSAVKYEAEVVAMTAHMLGGARGSGVCGTLSSGGTESILLAMKAYRDWAREERGIRRPRLVAPITAHAAFDKAAQYFGLELVKIPVDASFRADLRAARHAVNRRTAVVVGSAPSFPHGVIDPIEQLSELARARGAGFHTDACLGGFVLPWAQRLGYRVPPFDFRLRGVTSISADTHKYGYAPKGSSVILYRDPALRRHQFFTATDWPGGLYYSPGFAGSRPGALVAACWAALVSVGEQGYLDATRRILETAAVIRRGVEAVPELYVLGDPLWVIAFGSEELDIYRVMEQMGKRGWSLNGLHRPACIHICVTLRHTQPGVAERFASDLQAAAAHVRAHPEERGGMAPVYGMAATVPARGAVGDLLARYIDMLYEV